LEARLVNGRMGAGSRLSAGKERNREGRRFRSSILLVLYGLAQGFLFWQDYSTIMLFCQFGHKASCTVAGDFVVRAIHRRERGVRRGETLTG
jgi:hypothetical protein